MSEDITKQPLPTPRPERRGELTDYPPTEHSAPPYPWQMIAAGILWIVLGVLVLFCVILMAVSIMIRAGGQNGDPPSTGFLTWLAFMALCSASLMVVGGQSIRGTLRKLVPNMVGSVALGLFEIGWVIYKIAGGQFNNPNIGFIILTGVEGLVGVLLLSAGVLALLGRSQYEQWRKTPNPDSARRSRFYKQNLSIGAEQLLKESQANLFRGWQSVGGWLYLTDQRLLYRPHRFNFRKQEPTKFNIDKDELSIPLAEIEAVGAYAVSGMLPTGLQVTTSLGVRKFVVSERAAWVEAIEEARKFHS